MFKIKTMIFMFVFLVLAVWVYADEEPEGSLTMEEFLLLDNTTLNNFNETLLGVESGAIENKYVFELTLYKTFSSYEYADEESDDFITTLLMKPERKQDYFGCPHTTTDCESAYLNFIEDYKTWWMSWYDDLKEDYE